MKETGCAAVKLEGGEAMAPTVEFLTHRGIPVIGHVGLTPQAVNVLGGYGARGKDEREAEKIERDALAVDKAGAFCIVVEGVMEEHRLAARQPAWRAGNRNRRFGGLRRPGSGDRGFARPFRAHAAVREALR